MKLSFAVLCLATPATTYAFTPARASGRNSALLATVEAPQREAPGAGYVPEWENRPGLTEEEFMKSDMTKPDLSEMWECPLTRWDSDTIDIKQAQKEAAKAPHCPLEVRASESDNQMGAEYFAKNKDQIRQDLLKHGSIWFRGFDLMKGVAGHREMYEALELEPCLDPLHSSGLRKFSSERDALYEEVGIFLFDVVIAALSYFELLSVGQ